MYAALQTLRLVRPSSTGRTSSRGTTAASRPSTRPAGSASGGQHDATIDMTPLPAAHTAISSPEVLESSQGTTAADAAPPSYASPTLSHIDDPEKLQIESLSPQPGSSTSPDSADGTIKETEGANALRSETPETPDVSRPPSLEYSLHHRKLFIAVFWALILIDSIAIPLVMYFCLHYLTSLSPNDVFSISTACLGGVSILEYVLRFWRLYKKTSTCRIIGQHPWYYLDWFHWNFSAAWVFIMVELIVGTSFDNPPIRLLAMPPSSLCYWFSLLMLTQTTMRALGFRSPVRISSIPAGEPLRPAVYSLVEDICAVDGSGGTEFRQRLNTRYEASHEFRQMLHRITVVWAVNMLAIAIATTTLIFTLDDGEIAYIVGWTAPFVWAGIWTLWTFWYVKRRLRFEYVKWAERKVVP